MTLLLKDITRENWETCVRLQPSPEQAHFVAPNVYSLAEAKYQPSYVPQAIYDDEQMVGFLMYGRDPEDCQYWLVRLMIHQAFQRQGLGKAAVQLLIDRLRKLPDCDSIIVGYHPQNTGAGTLYEKCGFRLTGQVIHGEVIARVDFRPLDRIHGDKVVLRSIQADDMKPLWNMIYGDPDPEWKRWDAPYFPLEHITFERFMDETNLRLNRAGVPSVLGIEVNGQLVGQVSYYWEHKPSKWLEVGIVIYEPKFWSGGYGTEALRLWVDYLFSQLDIPRAGLTTWSGNVRMIRCAEKVGMQMEGRMRQCRTYNGQLYDSIRMGILRDEWEAANLSQ